MGYAWYDAYEAVRQTKQIGYHLGLLDTQHRKYVSTTLEKLINGEITIDQIKAEYQPIKEAQIKRDAAQKAKEEAERLERHREWERSQLEVLQNAAQTVSLFICGDKKEEVDRFERRLIKAVETGQCTRTEIMNLAQGIHEYELEKQIEAAREERRRKAEEEQIKLKSQQEENQSEYTVLAAKGQFRFDDLLIQRQRNSTSFLLPNEEKKEVTAYEIIERLSGEAFKLYKKKITPRNNKMQILPYSERFRISFYFRRQYKMPPVLENAEMIVTFINTALKYTNNIELSQQWHACLDAVNTPEEAASLFVYYGWAKSYKKELPREENAFYTVETKNNVRYYEIVEDDLSIRLEAIERQGRGPEAYQIITNKNLEYHEKYDELQCLLKPLLWRRDNIRLGLTKAGLDWYYDSIGRYIDELLSYNAFDNISLQEHISRVEIDKSIMDIKWAQPRQFVIGMDDLEFTDYQYNIDADFNKHNAAELGKARSKKAARRNFERLPWSVGDIVTTAELNAHGISPNQITRLVKQALIKREKRGLYRIISS